MSPRRTAYIPPSYSGFLINWPGTVSKALRSLQQKTRQLIPITGLRSMGTFYTKCKVENPVDRARSVVVPKLLVDTGSEYSWVSERTLERIGIRREKKDVAFVLANGQRVTRSVGFAIIRLDKFFTIDEVVYAEPGDLPLLGDRTLDGLNLTIEPGRKGLIAAGPLPAASPAGPSVVSRATRTR